MSKDVMLKSMAEKARELDDRYARIMEKMMEADTWTDEADLRFNIMYENFQERFGRYLTKE